MENNNMAAARAQAARAGTSGIPLRALVFSGVILALSLMIYVGLEFGYKNFLIASIKNLDTQITALDQLAPADDKERNFIEFYSLATNVQNLLTKHVAISPVFDFFERNTLPDVVIETMKIAVREGTVAFSGAARSYEQLATQLAIYENAPEAINAGLAGSRLGNNVVQFEARSTMTTDLFSSVTAIKMTETGTETTPTTVTTTPTP